MSNKPMIWSSSSIFSSGLTVLGLLSGGMALAQEAAAPEARIEAAEAVLRSLDEQARVCLERLAEADGAGRPGECTDFLASIDGEMLGGYLEHCAELRQWREDYVGNPPPAGPDSERDRQRLIAVERVCGENALRQRTEFVAAAFEELDERRTRQMTGLSLQRRLNEIEFQSSLGGWRSELETTDPNRRVRNETRQQFDQLEEELIRQQINRPR